MSSLTSALSEFTKRSELSRSPSATDRTTLVNPRLRRDGAHQDDAIERIGRRKRSAIKGDRCAIRDHRALLHRLADYPRQSGPTQHCALASPVGVYFTMGGLYYADPKGVVTRYGENLTTNGIVLSDDEKRLFVTNGPALAVFDVQKDGALTNQREFVKLEGCAGFQGPCTGDGSTFDAAGRLYVTSQAGVQVIGPDGRYLGLIPRRAISSA